MIKCNIIAVGSLKENYWQQAVAEYLKRLSRFASVTVLEAAEEKEGKNTDISTILDKEGERLLALAKGIIVALDSNGQAFTSQEFADLIAKFALDGRSEISFLIGGSYGLSEGVKNKADLLFSLGRLTYPHQLARVIMAEQLYRAFTIKENTRYHK